MMIFTEIEANMPALTGTMSPVHDSIFDSST